MEVPLYNQQAEQIGTVKLEDRVFNVPLNKDLLYQVVTSQMSNRRQVIAHTKGRSEVRGGGKKPWQQKGTGRARHGSIRSPIWKGGGVTHGPTKERNFKKKINVKMARKAVCVALSEKLRNHQLAVIDALTLTQPKTKEMAKYFTALRSVFKGQPGKTVVVISGRDEMMRRAARNIPNLDVLEAGSLNSLAILSSKYTLFLKDAAVAVTKHLKIAA